MAERPPFHLAFPVDDLDAARGFYRDVLGCREGRSSETWVDFDLAGHQIVAHLDPAHEGKARTNAVDGDEVPIFHFGLILTVPDFETMADRLKAADADFIVEPRVRFKGQPGEQHTMFVRDPAGNGLEFKAFADPSRIFAR
ncbi:VOC family protein [Sphingomicrobium clamense]|uniref:VOC family protein n=1 Tax=Sphingomicrobium clamense TaxID=2851013 RepID=A0ABS6V2Q4_9SPHN|nr:VOC family protein [Sphingomicrobium sp. B8]MBW0143821.1 VOC family protein [Sphingomicrobium sp. B8]